MPAPLTSIAAFTAVAALAAGGVAIAADGATQITVERSATLMPGQTSPFDAPGVRAIRRGKPIPAGYRLVGQRVTNTRGLPSAGAALYFRCPDGKRLKTFGISGNIGAGVDREYVDHRDTWIRTHPGTRGQTTTGVVYAVCR